MAAALGSAVSVCSTFVGDQQPSEKRNTPTAPQPSQELRRARLSCRFLLVCFEIKPNRAINTQLDTPQIKYFIVLHIYHVQD